jgi:hypothetical protein
MFPGCLDQAHAVPLPVHIQQYGAGANGTAPKIQNSHHILPMTSLSKFLLAAAKDSLVLAEAFC